jgi:hypothetical protein
MIMKKITLFLVIFVCWAVPGNILAQSNGVNPKNIVSRFIDSTGREIIGIRVPGKPPDHLRMPEANPAKSAVIISNVPAFTWSFGCSATSAAMQAAFYDRTGYYNMYAGPTQDGLMPMDNSTWPDVIIHGETRSQCPLSATRNGVDGRTIKGHVDDYWISYGSTAPDPYISGGWTQHTWGQCTGDYMGTNQSALSNSDGSTTFYFATNGSATCNHVAPAGEKDGCYGLRKFYESRGYTVLSNCNQLIFGYNGNILGFSFAQYIAEIDAGRPVLIQVDDHTMLGFGYDVSGSVVYLHDTWDHLTHTMTWGGYYNGLQHFGVTTIQLQDYTPNPCTDIISLDEGGAANDRTYWGGGIGVWNNTTVDACGNTAPGIEQVYSFVAPVSGYYSIQVTATGSTYVDYMWKSGACSSTGWTCIADVGSPGTYGSMYMTAGNTYYILLDDRNSSEEAHTFYIFLNPCLNITSIGGTGSGNSKTYTGGGYGAWFTTTHSPCTYICYGREKVYSFIAPYTGLYSVVVTAASGKVDYMWQAGGACSSSGWQCIDDIYTSGTYGSMLMTIGETYYILLDDENTTAGSHTFYLNCTEPAGTWTGLVSTDWTDPGNWSAGTVPDETINVTIPSGTPHQPTIGSGVSTNARNVSIQAGAVLTQSGSPSGSYFYVYGDFNTDAGQFVMTGISYLYFSGSAGNSWDDDNENDVYTNVRVEKSVSTAQTMMWQNMTCSGTFEVREGIFSIDGTWALTITNTGTAAFEVEDGGKVILADETIDCAGDVHFFNGSQAEITGGTIECGGDFVVDANASYNIVFAAGTLRMTGIGTTYINDLDGGMLDLYNLIIEKTSGVCYIKSANLDINNQLNIAGGVLSCDNGPRPTATYNIYIAGNWYNTVGPGGFDESTGTVIFNGSGHQYCLTDNFNNIIVNKSAGALRLNGAIVTCAQYNWTAGAVDVLSGTFTASSLADNAIAGYWYLNPGGTINLYNTGGRVDLNGYLYIYGGDFNIYGGSSIDSYWPLSADAGISMSGGTLDFKNVGVLLYNTGAYTFTEDITDGTIRTSGGFRVERSDFTPEGGTIEFYGTTNGNFHTINGGYVKNVLINKAATDAPLASAVIIDNVADIRGNVTIQTGTLVAGDNTVYVEGDWNNLVGDAGFSEGTSIVDFIGASDADIASGETFYNMYVGKTNANSTALELLHGLTLNILNNLNVYNGSFELNGNTTINVGNDLVLVNGAGLNANDAPLVTINIGGDWTNNNSDHSSTNGFDPGNYSVVTFNGTVNQYLATACPQEDFYRLIINKSSGEFKPNDNIRCYGDMEISTGTWEDNIADLTHSFYRDFTVTSAGVFFTTTHPNTVEFIGTPNSTLTYASGTGYFHNLIINKATGYAVTQVGNTSSQFEGDFTVENGIFNMNGYVYIATGNVTVNDAGVLYLPPASSLVLTYLKSLAVNSGGLLDIAGTSADNATIRANMTSSRYSFDINSGGAIAADYCVFKNMNANGLYVHNGATVDVAHAFKGCTFQDGSVALLIIDNNQVLTIRNAVFPTNTWGGSYNAGKTINQGHLYFVDYSGGFSGESFDYDPFNLVDWVPTLTATATATPNTICAGSSSQLNVNRTGGMASYSYHWSPSAGLSDANIINPVATPSSTVTYYVTVTDGLGTTAVSNVQLTVNPVLPVNVTIAASANPSPPGNYVTFTATPVNGGTSPSYQWKVNGTIYGTSPTYQYVPSYGDEVVCVLTSNDPCPSGNPATSNTITMVIVPVNTTATGTITGGPPVCIDASNIVTLAGGGSTFRVNSGGSANVIAGYKISIQPTTIVDPGGSLHGYITTTNEYCGSLPPAMVATVTGVSYVPTASVPGSQEFTIFPNPTTGAFTLQNNGANITGTVRVEIYNIRGDRILSTSYIGERSHMFSLPGLPAGICFVKVTAGDQIQSFKLIITP